MKTPSSTPDLDAFGSPPAHERTYWDHPGNLGTSDALSEDECWALATTASMGRIGFFRREVLDIVPVNCLVLDHHLYFRTSADGMIATSFLEHAAFQLDHTDRESRTGWTILLNGPVGRVEDAALLTTLWGTVIDEPWAPGPRDLFLRMAPTLVRGRRVGTAH